jgi:hypothetical protein
VNTKVGFGRNNMLKVRAHLKLLIKVFDNPSSIDVIWYAVWCTYGLICPVAFIEMGS